VFFFNPDIFSTEIFVLEDMVYHTEYCESGYAQLEIARLWDLREQVIKIEPLWGVEFAGVTLDEECFQQYEGRAWLNGELTETFLQRLVDKTPRRPVGELKLVEGEYLPARGADDFVKIHMFHPSWHDEYMTKPVERKRISESRGVTLLGGDYQCVLFSESLEGNSENWKECSHAENFLLDFERVYNYNGEGGTIVRPVTFPTVCNLFDAYDEEVDSGYGLSPEKPIWVCPGCGAFPALCSAVSILFYPNGYMITVCVVCFEKYIRNRIAMRSYAMNTYYG